MGHYVKMLQALMNAGLPLKTVGERYQPNLGIVCVGDGPFTMGPDDAVRAPRRDRAGA